MKLDFCPQCAAPLTQKDSTTYECFNGHPFWNNAKAATAIILFKDGLAMFAERAKQPAKGLYDFPGGFVDYDETAEAAIRRELAEEAGIELGAITLIGATSNLYMTNISTVDLVYFCTDWTGDIIAADDVASFMWKPLECINADEFAWPTYRQLYPEIIKHTLKA